MKNAYLFLLFPLAGCAGFTEAIGVAISDPVIQDQAIDAVGKAVSGNYVGALWGVGSIAASVLSYKVVKSVKASSRDKLFG